MFADTCTTHEALATPVHADDAYWGGVYVNNAEHVRRGLSTHPASIGVLAGIGNYARAVDMLQHGERFDALPEAGLCDTRECGRSAHGFGRVITTTMVRVYAFVESCARRCERGDDFEYDFIRWRVSGTRPRRRLTCRDAAADSEGWRSGRFADNYPGERWGTHWQWTAAERAGVPPRQGGAREGASYLEKLRAEQLRAEQSRRQAADVEGER